MKHIFFMNQKRNPNAKRRSRRDKKGNLTITAVKKDTWTIFSRYVRRRDCLKTGNFDMGLCITCGKPVEFKKGQAGHMVAGRNNAILFDERAVNLQCYSCNVIKDGDMLHYIEVVRDRHRQAVVDEIMRNSHQVKQWNMAELLEQQELFLTKLAMLDSNDELVVKYRKRGMLI